MAGVKRKQPKKYYKDFSKKSKGQGSLESGCIGFIVTSNFKEKECIQEAYNLLNEYYDKLYANETAKKDEKSDAEDDVTKELQQELDLLKQNKNEKMFQQVYTNVKHCLFVKTKLESPYKIADAIFMDIKSSQRQKTCNLLRLVPVSCTCQASQDKIKDSILIEIDTYLKLHPDAADSKYTIVFKARNNNQLSRTAIIPSLVTAISEKFPALQAVYKETKLFILINVLQTKCCLSIVENYNELCKFNLIELAGKSCTAEDNKSDEI